METSRDNDRRRSIYKNNLLQHQNHSLLSTLKLISLGSATSVLPPQSIPMAYHTTASMEKLVSTDYANFRDCQDRLG